MNEVMQRIMSDRIIAIVRGLGGEYMLGLAGALYDGGITMIEVTFDQKDPGKWRDTCDAISLISEKFAGRMLVGAGTVLTTEQLHMAAEAGAKYIISPDTNVEVIRETKKLGLVSLPGAMTPTECVTAYNAGADAVKVFPAGQLGPAYIKAIRAPLAHIPMLAVGGVNEKNAADFIKAGCIGLGIGGRLVNIELIKDGKFDEISALAREYIKAVH